MIPDESLQAALLAVVRYLHPQSKGLGAAVGGIRIDNAGTTILDVVQECLDRLSGSKDGPLYEVDMPDNVEQLLMDISSELEDKGYLKLESAPIGGPYRVGVKVGGGQRRLEYAEASTYFEALRSCLNRITNVR